MFRPSCSGEKGNASEQSQDGPESLPSFCRCPRRESSPSALRLYHRFNHCGRIVINVRNICETVTADDLAVYVGFVFQPGPRFSLDQLVNAFSNGNGEAVRVNKYRKLDAFFL